MPDFINWISLYSLMPTLCSMLYSREQRNKQEEFLFSRNLSSRLSFIFSYSSTVSFVFLMPPVKMTVNIGYSYNKYCCYLSPTVTLPAEWKSPEVEFCSVFLPQKRSTAFGSKVLRTWPLFHKCMQKWLIHAKYMFLSKNQFRTMWIFPNSTSSQNILEKH